MSPPSRKLVPARTRASVLFRSRRRCCLCAFWDNDLSQKEGQIAHIDHDPRNVDEDNLVYLCLSHHCQYDARSVQGKAVAIQELRHARESLYQVLGSASESFERPVTVTIEIDRSFEDFTEADQQRLIDAIQQTLGTVGDIRVLKLHRGSIKIDVELEFEEAFFLLAAIDSAPFASQRVKAATISKILNCASRLPSPGYEDTELLTPSSVKTPLPKGVSVLHIVESTQCLLRKIVHEKPTKERQIQDCYETLLVTAEIPYSRDKESFQYASRAYRPDFVIAPVDLAVEIKLCNTPARESDIIREINDDILAYRTKYANLLFIVYDVICIRDVDLFVEEFAKHKDVIVVVVKH